MAVASAAFMAWAEAYDTAGPGQRSAALHATWLSERACRVVRLDSAAALADLVENAGWASYFKTFFLPGRGMQDQQRDYCLGWTIKQFEISLSLMASHCLLIFHCVRPAEDQIMRLASLAQIKPVKAALPSGKPIRQVTTMQPPLSPVSDDHSLSL